MEVSMSRICRFLSVVGEVIHAAGLRDGVAYAYAAETHPGNLAVSRWRRLSRTKNAERVRRFLTYIPNGESWIDLAMKTFAEAPGSSATEKVFIAWIQGSLAQHEELLDGYPTFKDAVLDPPRNTRR
jgi:hypothetical protein